MKALFRSLSPAVTQYLIITGNYWAFTVTDGALRMLVVLHFYQLGYSPLEIALLFLFYEIFGVITNLLGGWLAALIGLNKTMNIGLALQIVALGMLAVAPDMLTIAWVMAAQAISGVAKDLNKMSAKASIKGLVPAEHTSALYRWIALLTGSKNALKGIGFFVGGLLLSLLGFQLAVIAMASALMMVWLVSLITLRNPQKDHSAFTSKPKFRELFSKSRSINLLALARFFLFGARDVWFVVALPVYLTAELSWPHASVGSFFAVWIIGYGVVQSTSPRISGKSPTSAALFWWSVSLTVLTTSILVVFTVTTSTQAVLVVGLLLFGAIFAVNSALHSYFVVAYARAEHAAMDVGFYYMANSLGRLAGTVLSGFLYMKFGLAACLTMSAVFLVLSNAVSLRLSSIHESNTNVTP